MLLKNQKPAQGTSTNETMQSIGTELLLLKQLLRFSVRAVASNKRPFNLGRLTVIGGEGSIKSVFNVRPVAVWDCIRSPGLVAQSEDEKAE